MAYSDGYEDDDEEDFRDALLYHRTNVYWNDDTEIKGCVEIEGFSDRHGNVTIRCTTFEDGKREVEEMGIPLDDLRRITNRARKKRYGY